MYATFLASADKPLAASVINLDTGKTNLIPLFAKHTGKSVYEATHNLETYSKFLDKIAAKRVPIITSDFKAMLAAVRFPLVKERLDIYDVMLPEFTLPDDYSALEPLLLRISSKLSKFKPQKWQNVLANAAVVYQSLENRGVAVGLVPTPTQWSLRTFSGRSKMKGFNLQGGTKDLEITNPYGRPDDVFLHFDWRGADIRIAAILSGDELLLDLSMRDDPYQEIANLVNGGSGAVTRDDCKQTLLPAINAMSADDAIFDMFPKLRAWITECGEKIDAGEPVCNILGRKYILQEGRNRCSVFNATMQGSIACAMQCAIRSVWEQFDNALVTEIHDSLVVSCRREPSVVKTMMREVGQIMCHPFSGIIDDHRFVVSVSIGKKWGKWERCTVYSN